MKGREVRRKRRRRRRSGAVSQGGGGGDFLGHVTGTTKENMTYRTLP